MTTTISPEIEAAIEEGRRELREGKGTLCHTLEEARAFLEAL